MQLALCIVLLHEKFSSLCQQFLTKELISLGNLWSSCNWHAASQSASVRKERIHIAVLYSLWSSTLIKDALPSVNNSYSIITSSLNVLLMLTLLSQDDLGIKSSVQILFGHGRFWPVWISGLCYSESQIRWSHYYCLFVIGLIEHLTFPLPFSFTTFKASNEGLTLQELCVEHLFIIPLFFFFFGIHFQLLFPRNSLG